MKTKTTLFALPALSLTLFSFNPESNHAKIARLDNGNFLVQGMDISEEDWSTITDFAAGGIIFKQTYKNKKDAEKLDQELITTTQTEETLSLASRQKIEQILSKYE